MPLIKIKDSKPRARTRYYAFTSLVCNTGHPIIKVYNRHTNMVKKFDRTKLAICMIDFHTKNYYKK